MTAFVAGMAAGALLLIVACLIAAHFADRPARRAARDARAVAEQSAFREWCERVRWCPVHDAEDGSCPRVEVAVYGDASHRYRFDDCPGSAVLRPPAVPTPTGTRLETGAEDLPRTVWEYSRPKAP